MLVVVVVENGDGGGSSDGGSNDNCGEVIAICDVGNFGSNLLVVRWCCGTGCGGELMVLMM